MTKWIMAAQAAAKLFIAWRRQRKKQRIEKRIQKYAHQVDVLNAKMAAAAAGDPEPQGN